MTGVYHEVAVRDVDLRRVVAERRMLAARATQAEEASPSDLNLEASLAVKADAYVVSNPGTTEPTYVTPVPVRALYTAICEDLRLKPNRQAVENLPLDATTETLEKITTERTFVGGGAIRALVELMRICVNVTTVDFSGQTFSNDSMLHFTKVLRHHPRIKRVVLDDVFIEGEAALSLVRAVEGNARICTVSTTAACLIPTTTERRLQEATKRNSKIMRNVASSRATLQLLPKALYASVKRQLRSGSETV